MCLQLLQINMMLFDWPAQYERDTSVCSGWDLVSIKAIQITFLEKQICD